MTVLTIDVGDQLAADLARAGEQLGAARLRQAQKDTPGNRAAVADCWTRIDGLLDLYLTLGTTSADRTGATASR